MVVMAKPVISAMVRRSACCRALPGAVDARRCGSCRACLRGSQSRPNASSSADTVRPRTLGAAELTGCGNRLQGNGHPTYGASRDGCGRPGGAPVSRHAVPLKDLDAIFTGRCTLAFRRWKRPTVKVGGTVRTARGLVGIDAIEPIEPEAVTEDEARAAGYPDRAGVLAMFASQEGPATASPCIRLEPTRATACARRFPMKRSWARSSASWHGWTPPGRGPRRCCS